MAHYTTIDVDAALADWLDGEVIARTTNRYDETTVVTRNGDLFSLFRAFPLGLEGECAVSCDLQEKPIKDVLAKLLSA